MKRRLTNRRKPGAALPGRVRIVAGKWRGRFLPVADIDGLRPTSERIRETLFNWLTPQIEGSRCLDLFAGTGALGIEALSRGAASAVLVEKSREAAEVLTQNASLLGATTASVICADALDYLDTAQPSPRDIVFLDPPFDRTVAGEACRLLSAKEWLVPGAVVYLEQDARNPVPELPPGWTMRREKKAGNVRYFLLDARRQEGPRVAPRPAGSIVE